MDDIVLNNQIIIKELGAVGVICNDSAHPCGCHKDIIRFFIVEKSLAGAFPPKTLIGQAISYALGEYPKAARFVDHPLLRPDTNLVENQIRPFVVGRKGWLFMDSPSGATASAAFYGIIATARLNGHEPLRYLTYVFDEIARRGADDSVDDLLPYALDPNALLPVKTG